MQQTVEPERELTEYEQFYINQLAELVLLSIVFDNVEECLAAPEPVRRKLA